MFFGPENIAIFYDTIIITYFPNRKNDVNAKCTFKQKPKEEKKNGFSSPASMQRNGVADVDMNHKNKMKRSKKKTAATPYKTEKMD